MNMSVFHEMMIGLGPTGGECLRAFRCIVEGRRHTAAAPPDEEIRFDYLYIDDEAHVAQSAEWHFEGESIRLQEDDVICLCAPPRNHLPMEQLRHSRRVGFRLFPAAEVRRRLRAKWLEHGAHAGDKVIVHLFCSAAEGSGSGGLPWLISEINLLSRALFLRVRVYIHLFISELDYGDERRNACFAENQYTTLRDLNALMLGCFSPRGRYSDDDFPFFDTYCDESLVSYVFLSASRGLGKPAEEEIEQVAHACYDMILFSRNEESNRNVPTVLKDAESLVDINPGEPAGPHPLRSYRWAGVIGGRWCIPVRQMKEILKLDCERRVLRAWRRGEHRQELSRKTMESLCEKLLSEENKAVNKILEELKATMMEKIREAQRNLSEKGLALESLRTPVSEIMDEFREKMLSEGGELQQVREFSACLKQSVERDAEAAYFSLLRAVDERFDWRHLKETEAWGIEDIQHFLNYYLDYRSSWLRRTTVSWQDVQERDAQLALAMLEREKQWAKMGFLTILVTKKPQKLLCRQVEDAVARMENLFRFGEQAILDKVHKLLEGHLIRLRVLMEEMNEELHLQEKKAEDAEARAMNALTKQSPYPRGVTCEYPREDWEDLRRGMSENIRCFAEQMADTYSPAWREYIESFEQYDSARMVALAQKISQQLAYETSRAIYDDCMRDRSHRGQVQSSLLNSGLLDFLAELAGPDESLWEERIGDRVETFIRNLRYLISFELWGQSADPSLSHHPSPDIFFLISYPEQPEHAALSRWILEKIIQQLHRHIHIRGHGRVAVSTRCAKNEIRVQCVPHWFPARRVREVIALHERYAQREKRRDSQILYFANTDDDGIPLESPTRPALVDLAEKTTPVMKSSCCGKEKLID